MSISTTNIFAACTIGAIVVLVLILKLTISVKLCSSANLVRRTSDTNVKPRVSIAIEGHNPPP